MSAREITIRSLQHYIYCPHRWGLCEIEGLWQENALTAGANLLHQRAHDPEKSYTSRNAKVYTSVSVYNDDEDLMLYGVLDCLEAVPDKNGTALDGVKSRLTIIEYKPTKPKGSDYNSSDLMQLFAQKLCADNVFGCNCGTAFYYADVKKRINVDFYNDGMYESCLSQLKAQLAVMREALDKRVVPRIVTGQKCSGCSMSDICIPKAGKNVTTKQQIEELMAQP